MTVVSNSSPLITFAKIGRLELLHHLYDAIAITPEVYDEVVVAGTGLTGAIEVAAAKWIHVRQVEDPAALAANDLKFGLGIGELSAIILGKELNARLVLIDEIKARKVARQQGLDVLGCVGALEDAFGLNLLPDLPQAYRQLLASGAYVDRRILENSLANLNLAPL